MPGKSKKSKVLSIAPSGLHWTYEKCPRCYWNQIHRVWKKPYMPFPSVFSRIDKAMREDFHQLDTSALKGMSPNGMADIKPRGILLTKELTVKSRPFELGGKLFQYSCKTDAIAEFPDDGDSGFGIYDFKTSKIDPDRLIDQYLPQLMCMAATLSDSKNSPYDGLPAIDAGIICFEPTTFRMSEGTPNLTGDLQFVRLDLNGSWSWWADYEHKLHELLAGPCPEPTGDCQWCAIQQAMECWSDTKTER